MEDNNMKRGLNSRHISMIAIGGAIGTGLFVATGSVISQAGPGGAILAYILIGIMLYFLMSSIGELATFYPVSGSFSSYSTRFVDPSLGFTMGWLYWGMWSLVTSVDVIVASNVLQFWDVFKVLSPLVWSLIFLTFIFLINIFSVKAFGETEFWLSLIKVITIIVFIIFGVLMIFGILGGHSYGFENYTKGQAPFVGGISGILSVLLVAGFSVGGTEVVAVTAGESNNPQKSMPKAIKQVFWRILLFYILAIFIIGMLIPYDSKALMGGGDSIATSPFTLVFKNAGLAFAASFMNAVILTSVLSAGNSGMYASTRMLYSMSKDKLAYNSFGKTNKSGVPYVSLIATGVLVILIFALQHLSGDAYEYIVAASGMTGFIAWVGIAISHFRFRRAFDKQNYDKSKLKYKAKLFPFGPIFAGILCVIVIIGQDVDFIKTGNFDMNRFFITYMGIPVFLIFFFYHKFRYKTKKIPLNKVDLRQDVSMEEIRHHKNN